jgi:hypothetical protein
MDESPVTFGGPASLHGVRLLKRILAVLFAIAAVLAGFLVAVVAAMAAALFFVFRGSQPQMARARQSAVAADDVIDISTSEIRADAGLRLER